MGDLVLLNFKVPPESAYSIQREMGFHDLNRSEFVRQCIRIAGPLLREAPGLLEADEKFQLRCALYPRPEGRGFTARWVNMFTTRNGVWEMGCFFRPLM